MHENTAHTMSAVISSKTSVSYVTADITFNLGILLTLPLNEVDAFGVRQFKSSLEVKRSMYPKADTTIVFV